MAPAWIVWAAGAGGVMAITTDASPSPSFHPSVTLSVRSGVPGTVLTITAIGFPPNQPVAEYIDVLNPDAGTPQPIFLSTPFHVDAQGDLIQQISWPNNPLVITAPGTYNVCIDTGSQWAIAPYAAKACAPFTVEGTASSTPAATPSPTPTPTIAPTPAAATTPRPGPPVPALLAGAALLIVAAGAGALWYVRTGRS
jgi:hypothetical protein